MNDFCNELRHLDLFSGIGGFSLAAQWAGFKTIAFVERESFCQKILAQHWPDVPIYSDICHFGGKSLRPISLLTGGFPCQPFSCTGKQRGKEDDRYLWPEMLRVIQTTNPDWIIGENVAGLDGLGLDDCISDLEASGYEVAPPLEIPACSMGAIHRRNRLWIVANRISERCTRVRHEDGQAEGGRNNGSGERGTFLVRPSLLCDADSFLRKNRIEEMESVFLGKNDGIPTWSHQTRALGNSIVPQVAFQIIKAIRQEIDKAERRVEHPF